MTRRRLIELEDGWFTWLKFRRTKKKKTKIKNQSNHKFNSTTKSSKSPNDKRNIISSNNRKLTQISISIRIQQNYSKYTSIKPAILTQPKISTTSPPSNIRTNSHTMNRFTNSNQSSKKPSSQARFPTQQGYATNARSSNSSSFSRANSHLLNPAKKPTPQIIAGFTPTVNTFSIANQAPVVYAAEFQPKSPEQKEADRREIFRQTVQLVEIQRSKAPGHLPKTPDRNHPSWTNRCFNCHDENHTFPYCPLPLHCAKCGRLGHVQTFCPATHWTDPSLDPLIPTAHTDPEDFPTDRIDLAQIHLHKQYPEHKDNNRDYNLDADLTRYDRCIVVDARLMETHDRVSLHGLLNKSRVWENKLQLAFWQDNKYIVSLPAEVDPQAYCTTPPPSIADLGFVFYQWSYKEKAVNNPYRFKVWLDLYHLPTFTWRTEQIRHIVSTFGMLLIHSPTSYLDSIEQLRVVVMITNLSDVPHIIKVHCKEFTTSIPIQFAGWCEVEFFLSLEPNYVPSEADYEQARTRAAAIRAQKNRPAWQQTPTTSLPINQDENTMLVGESTLQDLLNSADKEAAIKGLLVAMQKNKMAINAVASGSNVSQDSTVASMDGDTDMAT